MQMHRQSRSTSVVRRTEQADQRRGATECRSCYSSQQQHHPRFKENNIQCDSPENLLYGAGQCFGWVFSLGSCQTNELSATERKRSSD